MIRSNVLGNKEAEFFLASGKKLWDAKKYKEALNNFKKIYGILPEAAYWIGCCYYYGLGVPKNIDKALKYFEKGAQLGWIECNVILGTHYQLLKHLDAATHYFAVATKKGHKESLNSLISLAEEDNYAEAQYNLAECYHNGEGVEKNFNQFINYLASAARNGHENSLQALIKLAEEDNCPEAEFALAYCYEYGAGPKQDLNKAIEYYVRAINHGNCSDSLTNLEYLVDDKNKNYPEAQYSIAVCYQTGKNVRQNLDKAIRYFTSASEMGHTKSQEVLLKLKINKDPTYSLTPKKVEYNGNPPNSSKIQDNSLQSSTASVLPAVPNHLPQNVADRQNNSENSTKNVGAPEKAAPQPPLATNEVENNSHSCTPLNISETQRNSPQSSALSALSNVPNHLSQIVRYRQNNTENNSQNVCINKEKNHDIESQYNSARLYQYPKGVTKNLNKAIDSSAIPGENLEKSNKINIIQKNVYENDNLNNESNQEVNSSAGIAVDSFTLAAKNDHQQSRDSLTQNKIGIKLLPELLTQYFIAEARVFNSAVVWEQPPSFDRLKLIQIFNELTQKRDKLRTEVIIFLKQMIKKSQEQRLELCDYYNQVASNSNRSGSFKSLLEEAVNDIQSSLSYSFCLEFNENETQLLSITDNTNRTKALEEYDPYTNSLVYFEKIQAQGALKKIKDDNTVFGVWPFFRGDEKKAHAIVSAALNDQQESNIMYYDFIDKVLNKTLQQFKQGNIKGNLIDFFNTYISPIITALAQQCTTYFEGYGVDTDFIITLLKAYHLHQGKSFSLKKLFDAHGAKCPEVRYFKQVYKGIVNAHEKSAELTGELDVNEIENESSNLRNRTVHKHLTILAINFYKAHNLSNSKITHPIAS